MRWMHDVGRMRQLIDTVVMIVMCLFLQRVHVYLMRVLLIVLVIQVAPVHRIELNVQRGIRWRFGGEVRLIVIVIFSNTAGHYCVSSFRIPCFE